MISRGLCINRRRRAHLMFEKFAIRASASSGNRSSRRVYTESQSQATSPMVAAKEIASFIVPAGTFVVITFGMICVVC